MLSRLLREWQARLVGLRQRVADSTEPRPWVALVQIRVLRYLIARYGREPVGEFIPPGPAPPPSWPIPFGPVEVDGPPPRSGEAIRRLLLDIHWRNRAPCSRWRWWP